MSLDRSPRARSIMSLPMPRDAGSVSRMTTETKIESHPYTDFRRGEYG